MSLGNPPNFPALPRSSCPQSLAWSGVGSLGVSSYDHPHARNGLFRAYMDSKHILPTSHNIKICCENKWLYKGAFRNPLGAWEGFSHE